MSPRYATINDSGRNGAIIPGFRVFLNLHKISAAFHDVCLTETNKSIISNTTHIPECFRDKGLIIKRYINSSVYFTSLLYCTRSTLPMSLVISHISVPLYAILHRVRKKKVPLDFLP